MDVEELVGVRGSLENTEKEWRVGAAVKWDDVRTGDKLHQQ